jgi:hypothetical protein
VTSRNPGPVPDPARAAGTERSDVSPVVSGAAQRGNWSGPAMSAVLPSRPSGPQVVGASGPVRPAAPSGLGQVVGVAPRFTGSRSRSAHVGRVTPSRSWPCRPSLNLCKSRRGTVGHRGLLERRYRVPPTKQGNLHRLFGRADNGCLNGRHVMASSWP